MNPFARAQGSQAGSAKGSAGGVHAFLQTIQPVATVAAAAVKEKQQMTRAGDKKAKDRVKGKAKK